MNNLISGIAGAAAIAFASALTPAMAVFSCTEGAVTTSGLTSITTSQFAAFDSCSVGDKIFTFLGASANVAGSTVATITLNAIPLIGATVYQVFTTLGTPLNVDLLGGSLSYNISVSPAGVAQNFFLTSVELQADTTNGAGVTVQKAIAGVGTLINTNGNAVGAPSFTNQNALSWDVTDSWTNSNGILNSISNAFTQDQSRLLIGEPATLALLGAGLLGLGLARRRRC